MSTNYVILPGHYTSVKTVTCGVPQGSTLGPLLFLLYINNLQSVFSKCVVHHFADNTKLLFSAKKLGAIESVINHELKLLVQWFQSRKHLPREPDIRINNYKLKLHSHIKYLGILIDEVLSWNKQIDDICTKLARANGIISKLCHFIPKNMCISIFSFILLSYPLWLFGLILLNPT